MPGTPGDGSGLGLAIVKEVIDRHEGTIDVARDSELGGACMHVSFPKSPAIALPAGA
jgi:two-component system sensor histidine kinase TctE